MSELTGQGPEQTKRTPPKNELANAIPELGQPTTYWKDLLQQVVDAKGQVSPDLLEKIKKTLSTDNLRWDSEGPLMEGTKILAHGIGENRTNTAHWNDLMPSAAESPGKPEDK